MRKLLVALVLLSSPVFADKINVIRCFSGVPTDFGNPEPTCYLDDTLRNIDKKQLITVYYVRHHKHYSVEGNMKYLTLDGDLLLDQVVDLYMLGNFYPLHTETRVPIQDIDFVLVDGDGE